MPILFQVKLSKYNERLNWKPKKSFGTQSLSGYFVRRYLAKETILFILKGFSKNRRFP